MLKKHMKNGVILLVSFILMSVSMTAELVEHPEGMVRIQTPTCKVGEIRCMVKAFQECDGVLFVTKKLCGFQQVCDAKQGGCIARSQRIIPPQTGASKTFDYWRYRECRPGQIKCNKRFIRLCKNYHWIDEDCKADEFCHPIDGCVKQRTTRFRERELNIPRTPKVRLLHYN